MTSTEVWYPHVLNGVTVPHHTVLKFSVCSLREIILKLNICKTWTCFSPAPGGKNGSNLSFCLMPYYDNAIFEIFILPIWCLCHQLASAILEKSYVIRFKTWLVWCYWRKPTFYWHDGCKFTKQWCRRNETPFSCQLLSDTIQLLLELDYIQPSFSLLWQRRRGRVYTTSSLLLFPNNINSMHDLFQH